MRSVPRLATLITTVWRICLSPALENATSIGTEVRAGSRTCRSRQASIATPGPLLPAGSTMTPPASLICSSSTMSFGRPKRVRCVMSLPAATRVTALRVQTLPWLRNLGKGQFQDATYSSRLARLTNQLTGWSTHLVDLNKDGWKDLFTANSHVTDNIEFFSGDRYKQPNSVFVNQGDGTFSDGSAASAPAFAVARAHRGAVMADFDGDGKLDIVVTVLSEKPE